MMKSVFFGVTLSLCAAPVFSQNQGEPAPYQAHYDFAPSSSSCTFPVTWDITGLIKVIALPGGRTIYTSPQQHALVTNSLTGKSTELLVTGVGHLTTDSAGVTNYEVTGRNLLTDPDYGMVLVVGNFSYAFDANGTLVKGLTPQGGSITKVCPLIG